MSTDGSEKGRTPRLRRGSYALLPRSLAEQKGGTGPSRPDSSEGPSPAVLSLPPANHLLFLGTANFFPDLRSTPLLSLFEPRNHDPSKKCLGRTFFFRDFYEVEDVVRDFEDFESGNFF